MAQISVRTTRRELRLGPYLYEEITHYDKHGEAFTKEFRAWEIREHGNHRFVEGCCSDAAQALFERLMELLPAAPGALNEHEKGLLALRKFAQAARAYKERLGCSLQQAVDAVNQARKVSA